MNLRTLFGALVLAVLAAGTLSAAEIPGSTLSSMGLGSMQRMSDHEGAVVRGQGLAIVWGRASAGGVTAPPYFNVNNISSQLAANGRAVSSGGGFSFGGSVAFAK